MFKRLSLFLFLVILNNYSYAGLGLFLAKDGSDVISKQSKVVVARKDNINVLTFTNEFESEADELMLLIPVSEAVKPSQVSMIDMSLLNTLEEYTSPRLVEYVNFDPCQKDSAKRPDINVDRSYTTIADDKAIGVSSKDKDIVASSEIYALTSKESDGIIVWLKNNGYNLNEKTVNLLQSYIASKSRFVVLKFKDVGDKKAWTAPVQITSEAKQFILPAAIGTANADGNQDMTITFLSSLGKIVPVSTNIREIDIGLDLPLSAKGDFPAVYGRMLNKFFDNHRGTMLLEYAWPANSCKPCTSEPVPVQNLIDLGATWYHLPKKGTAGLVDPASAIYMTRIHARFDIAQTPDNFMFEELSDRLQYQTYFKVTEFVDAAKSSCGNEFEQKAKKIENEWQHNLDKLVK